jgi:hypothetical protein
VISPHPPTIRRIRRLPFRPAIPGRELGEPWPRPTIPVKCPKCGRWRVPTTAMAGGIKFTSAGRAFTARGLNFVNDDGTCTDCNCDNPPGSGRNTVPCGHCTGGIMPASALLSFAGITYASCVLISYPNTTIQSMSKTGTGALGSYCMSAGGCGADLFPSQNTTLHNLTATFYSDALCASPFITGAAPANLYWRYGQQFGTSGPLGWTVEAIGRSGTFGVIWFYGFTETDGDCSTGVVVNNLISAGTFYDGISPIFVPGIGGGVNPSWGGSNGGSCVLTPQFQLCP